MIGEIILSFTIIVVSNSGGSKPLSLHIVVIGQVYYFFSCNNRCDRLVDYFIS